MAQERFQTPLAVFIIFQKDGEIWLQAPRKHGVSRRLYDVPWAMLKRGIFSAAAVREAKEETGVDAFSDLVVKHVLHNNIDWHINVFFLAKKVNGGAFERGAGQM